MPSLNFEKQHCLGAMLLVWLSADRKAINDTCPLLVACVLCYAILSQHSELSAIVFQYKVKCGSMNVLTEGLCTERRDFKQSSSAAAVLRCISVSSLVQRLDERDSVLGSEFQASPAFCHTRYQPLFSWISGWSVKVSS
jgi:hypothetical protein